MKTMLKTAIRRAVFSLQLSVSNPSNLEALSNDLGSNWKRNVCSLTSKLLNNRAIGNDTLLLPISTHEASILNLKPILT